MARLFFYLLVLGLLVSAGLYGYSFVLTPQMQPQSHEVTLELE